MTPQERFAQFVDKNGPVHPTLGACYLWTGATDKDGYGRFALDGYSSVAAYRAACILEYGSIPEGFEPDHLCLVKLCVRISHLEIVTKSVNSTRGARKVTDDQLDAIRDLLLQDDLTQKQIARMVGVSQGTVSYVKNSYYKYMKTQP